MGVNENELENHFDKRDFKQYRDMTNNKSMHGVKLIRI